MYIFLAGVPVDLLNSDDGAHQRATAAGRVPGCLAWSSLRIPARCGIDAVKIQPLAKKLNLSRTSFYWFSRTARNCSTGSSSRWRDKEYGQSGKTVRGLCRDDCRSDAQLFDCWLDGGLFDSSVRVRGAKLGLQSPEILAEVQSADQQRLDRVTRMFLRFGHGEARADVRARTIYLVQIGYISMQTKEDVSVRMKAHSGICGDLHRTSSGAERA